MQTSISSPTGRDLAGYHPALAQATGRKAPAARDFASSLLPEPLGRLLAAFSPERHVVRAGHAIYRMGDPFEHLFVLNSGTLKIVNLAPDGREQMVGLRFRGDWIGFDGIATEHYRCDAVVMDVSEVWILPYERLLDAASANPELIPMTHQSMSEAQARDRDTLVSICTLPAAARVADFLRRWAEITASRGMRADRITMSMTRGEIGNYLGMTIESVSRSFSRLASLGLICFLPKDRRSIAIPSIDALHQFAQTESAQANLCAGRTRIHRAPRQSFDSTAQK